MKKEDKLLVLFVSATVMGTFSLYGAVKYYDFPNISLAVFWWLLSMKSTLDLYDQR
ncbi:MAG: hypothetical protein JWP12_315 [Bacteroidetes bacterium]|nr:hypothetical protein [Bacteroidota bacterium]